MLRVIYESSFADRFTFLSGTCLRIVQGNQRFSEDLDFDNTGITEVARQHYCKPLPKATACNSAAGPPSRTLGFTSDGLLEGGKLGSCQHSYEIPHQLNLNPASDGQVSSDRTSPVIFVFSN